MSGSAVQAALGHGEDVDASCRRTVSLEPGMPTGLLGTDDQHSGFRLELHAQLDATTGPAATAPHRTPPPSPPGPLVSAPRRA
jgi:hypothetical protein